jgi:hypothetical protein
MISYATDVEGLLSYWDAYVARSGALVRSPAGATADDDALALREGTRFVYGGDVFDRGAGAVGGHRVVCCVAWATRLEMMNMTRTHARTHGRTHARATMCVTGPGDLRLARQLLSLKRRYPDRVTLLMGERVVPPLLPPAAIVSRGEQATAT